MSRLAAVAAQRNSYLVVGCFAEKYVGSGSGAELAKNNLKFCFPHKVVRKANLRPASAPCP